MSEREREAGTDDTGRECQIVICGFHAALQGMRAKVCGAEVARHP